MNLSTHLPSNRCLRISKISALIALISLGHIAEALQSSSVENVPLSLTSKLRTQTKNRVLESDEVYNVNTYFNLQLDYVPGEMGIKEEDRLAMLLEQCLLQNVPPFQATIDSHPFTLQKIHVVLGEQKLVEEITSVGFRSQYSEMEPYKEENGEVFRLNVEISVEGEYKCKEENHDSNHPMIPPTNKDFDYVLMRFFDVDEGGYTFLDSYISRPESTLSYFSNVKRINAKMEEDDEQWVQEPTLTSRGNPSSESSPSNERVAPMPAISNPLFLWATVMLLVVGVLTLSARKYFAERDRDGFSRFAAGEKEGTNGSHTSSDSDDSSTETIVYSIEGEESEEAIKYRCAPPPVVLPTGDVDIDATYEMSRCLANGYQMIQ